MPHGVKRHPRRREIEQPGKQGRKDEEKELYNIVPLFYLEKETKETWSMQHFNLLRGVLGEWKRELREKELERKV